MKFNYKNILWISLITSGILSSCNKDYLYPVPQTSVSDASAFSSPERIKGQVLSLYSSLKSGNSIGGRLTIAGDVKGEDFILEGSNLITGADVWARNATNSATFIVNIWSQTYYAINNINVFIDGMEASGATIVGAAQSASYVSEAKALRALAYFKLLELFARPYADGNGSKPGLPLRITAIKSPGQSELARSTVAEVYTQILKDLDEAETSIVSTYTGVGENTTRLHKNAIIALKAKVYLAMQQYDKVITEANKLVPNAAPFEAPTGVKHALQASPVTPFRTYTTTESIFSFPMTSTAGDYPGTQTQLGFYYSNVTGNAEYSVNPSGILGDAQFPATDTRKTLINTAGAKPFLIKYAAPSPFTDYAPVIRYADVLLTLAEALARTNTSGVNARSLALLNAVHSRSNAGRSLAPATNAELITAILKERRMEFLGEGLRNGDIMRLLAPLPARGTSSAVNPGDAGYIWPISSSELNLNKLCVDN